MCYCLPWLAAPCEGEGFVDLITSSGTLSSTARGLIRVCVDGNKGTVCDYGWGFADAAVACRAGGYSPYGNLGKISPCLVYECLVAPLLGAIPLDDQYLYYSSSYTSLMSYVNCIGNETVLTDCSYSTTFYCSYFNYAGVICQSEFDSCCAVRMAYNFMIGIQLKAVCSNKLLELIIRIDCIGGSVCKV